MKLPSDKLTQLHRARSIESAACQLLIDLHDVNAKLTPRSGAVPRPGFGELLFRVYFDGDERRRLYVTSYHKSFKYSQTVNCEVDAVVVASRIVDSLCRLKEHDKLIAAAAHLGWRTKKTMFSPSMNRIVRFMAYDEACIFIRPHNLYYSMLQIKGKFDSFALIYPKRKLQLHGMYRTGTARVEFHRGGELHVVNTTPLNWRHNQPNINWCVHEVC